MSEWFDDFSHPEEDEPGTMQELGWTATYAGLGVWRWTHTSGRVVEVRARVVREHRSPDGDWVEHEKFEDAFA